MEKPTHMVIVPSPGFSHLVSVIEFSKRLIHHSNGLHITVLIPTLGSRSEASISNAILQTLPSTIHATFLPSIHTDDLHQETPIAARVQLAVTRSLPFIRYALNSLSSSSRLVALVADLFACDVLVCAKELNLLSFIYFPSSAMTLSFCWLLPKLDQEIASAQFSDLPDPIQIPGCVPIHVRDLPNPVQDRSSQVYELFLQRCKDLLHLADGVMVNSFKDIEAGPIRALAEEGSAYPSVYPVGPIIQTGSGNLTNGSECLTWLDKQVPDSVLYVSFGSEGTLSQDQLNELALGLELSGQKFLWVVRAPSESANFAYLNSQKNDDPLQFLPSGFCDRTKEQGLVVPSWAPQVQVLSHKATGGFLTHCGWNSTLESIMNGMPLIAWPLFAEQRMNAVTLTDGLKVALRPKENENGLVEREEIAKVIRRLIEGEEGREIRGRMQKLKNAAAGALQEEGSSTKSLIQLGVHLMGN